MGRVRRFASVFGSSVPRPLVFCLPYFSFPKTNHAFREPRSVRVSWWALTSRKENFVSPKAGPSGLSFLVFLVTFSFGVLRPNCPLFSAGAHFSYLSPALSSSTGFYLLPTAFVILRRWGLMDAGLLLREGY